MRARTFRTREFTPERIEELRPDEVFVFGSNLNGNHAGGAARLAAEKFGAIEGQAEGLQGQSYAIPTLDESMQKLPIDIIRKSFEKLYEFDNDGNVIAVFPAIIDGVNIKEDTYYCVKNGKLVEVE